MADEADRATAELAGQIERSIRQVRAASDMDPGVTGECRGCGEDMPRLIGGRCGYCRDGRRRPQ